MAQRPMSDALQTIADPEGRYLMSRFTIRRWVAQAALSALLGLCLVAPIRADLTRRLSLADMKRQAGTIVVGSLTAVRVGAHPQYPRVPVTYVTLRVEDVWKGTPDRSLTFMQFGDASARGPVLPAKPGRVRLMRFKDLPTYAEGEEVLLFLRPPSEAGLTSPVGGNAGKLAIHRDPNTGQATVQGPLLDLSVISPAGSRSGEIALEAVRHRVVGAASQEGQGQ
jgi:hypothetical protein